MTVLSLRRFSVGSPAISAVENDLSEMSGGESAAGAAAAQLGGRAEGAAHGESGNLRSALAVGSHCTHPSPAKPDVSTS